MPRGTYANLRGRWLINLPAGKKRQNTEPQTHDDIKQEEEEAGKNINRKRKKIQNIMSGKKRLGNNKCMTNNDGDHSV